MMLSGKSLQYLPVYTEDKASFRYVDALVDSSGSQIKALVIRGAALTDTCDYVLPASSVKIINPNSGLYLDKECSELEEFELSADFPDLLTLNSFGIKLSDIVRLDKYNNGIYVDGIGQNYYNLKDLAHFKIHCLDDKLGKTRDILFEPESLNIKFLTVEVSQGFSKKWTFVHTELLDKVDWNQRISYLSVRKDVVLAGPMYKTETEVNDQIEKELIADSNNATLPHLHQPQASVVDLDTRRPIDF